MNTSMPTQMVKQQIFNLLDDLPLESLLTLEQFTRFLYDQEYAHTDIRKKTHHLHHPNVPVAASTLNMWTNLLPQGYTGNALTDTEALYDEV